MMYEKYGIKNKTLSIFAEIWFANKRNRKKALGDELVQVVETIEK